MSSDSYTSLLLHMDGENLGTTFTDSSTYNNTVTPSGDAKTIQSDKVFGTASYYSNALGNLSIPSSSNFDFGTGDFTIDFQAKRTSNSGVIIGSDTWSGGVADFTIDTFSAGLRIYWWQQGEADIGAAFPNNTWTHVAIVRTGGVLKVFYNGISQIVTNPGVYNNKPLALSATTFLIGDRAPSQFGNSAKWQGGLDEFRISKGIARWTTDFTPPASAYDMGSSGTIFPAPIVKGTIQTVSLDPALLTAIPLVYNDSYYYNPSNWKQVILLYDSPSHHTGNKKIVLENNGSNVFTKTYIIFSSKAESGLWTCNDILIQDYDGEYLRISGSNLPAGLDTEV